MKENGVKTFNVFFHISGREATYMDPQQRLFLEESWKALEDAGYAGDSVRGRECGVVSTVIAGPCKLR
jgi:polyketide synthase PksR